MRKQPFLEERVQQFNKSIKLLGKLSATALKILETLGSGGTERDAAKQANCTKSNVTYWKNKFVKQGLLKLVLKDVFKQYKLTKAGSTFFTTSEEPKVVEDYAVKFEVLESERCAIDWVKLGNPQNWQKLGTRIGSVRVVRTSKNIIIHSGKVSGFCYDDLLTDIGAIIEHVRSILTDRFGMVLSEHGQPLHKPIVRFYSEESKEDVKNGTVVVAGVGTIDNSPPERIPHEEYSGIDRAKARLMLPDLVKSLNDKIESQQAQIVALTTAMNSMADSVTKLGDAFGKLIGQAQAPSSQSTSEPVRGLYE